MVPQLHRHRHRRRRWTRTSSVRWRQVCRPPQASASASTDSSCCSRTRLPSETSSHSPRYALLIFMVIITTSIVSLSISLSLIMLTSPMLMDQQWTAIAISRRSRYESVRTKSHVHCSAGCHVSSSFGLCTSQMRLWMQCHHDVRLMTMMLMT